MKQTAAIPQFHDVLMEYAGSRTSSFMPAEPATRTNFIKRDVNNILGNTTPDYVPYNIIFYYI